MSSLAIHHDFGRKNPSSRLQGLVVVVALHAIVFYLLVTGVGRRALEIVKKPMEAVVIQEVIIPPPPPPPPKKVVPTEQAPKVEAPPPPFVPPTEVVTQPTNAPTITSAAVPPPTPAAIAPPAPAAVPAAKAAEPPAVDVEAEYSAKVRAMLNSTKRYPTGREASQTRPQGRVKVWFTLSRAGALLEVGVQESSNNNLLDNAAVATVRRGSYPPFPEKGWAGHDQNKFSADIEFIPPSQQ